MPEDVLRRLVLSGLCCVVLEGEARATSCPGPAYWWYDEHRLSRDDAPVDVRPWTRYSCYWQRPEDEYGACSLVAPDHEVSVALDNDDCAAEILFFVPDEELLPGRKYALICAEKGIHAIAWIETRASSEPAAPPEEVEVVTARYLQGDESCCGSDHVEVELADEFPAFLLEEGFIEVIDEHGGLHVIGRDRARDIKLPPMLEFSFTPIAADGTRGPTTRIGRRELEREAIYIPCAVTGGSPSFALWLMAPLLWMRAHGRRRRRAR